MFRRLLRWLVLVRSGRTCFYLRRWGWLRWLALVGSGSAAVFTAVSVRPAGIVTDLRSGDLNRRTTCGCACHNRCRPSFRTCRVAQSADRCAAVRCATGWSPPFLGFALLRMLNTGVQRLDQFIKPSGEQFRVPR